MLEVRGWRGRVYWRTPAGTTGCSPLAFGYRPSGQRRQERGPEACQKQCALNRQAPWASSGSCLTWGWLFLLRDWTLLLQSRASHFH